VIERRFLKGHGIDAGPGNQPNAHPINRCQLMKPWRLQVGKVNAHTGGGHILVRYQQKSQQRTIARGHIQAG